MIQLKKPSTKKISGIFLRQIETMSEKEEICEMKCNSDLILSIRLIRSFEYRNIRHLTVKNLASPENLTGSQLKEEIRRGSLNFNFWIFREFVFRVFQKFCFNQICQRRSKTLLSVEKKHFLLTEMISSDFLSRSQTL